MWRRPTVWRAVGVGAVAAVLAVVAGLNLSASASTLLSGDFEGGMTGWTTSGGAWSVQSDGSRVLAQGKLSSDNARAFAGSAAWTDYTVQARVKPLALPLAGSAVGILARAGGNTSFDRLALLAGGQAQLQAVRSGAVTILAGRAVPASTGNWSLLRLQESGSTVTAWVGDTLIGSGPSQAAQGRVGLQTLSATAEFDDVLVTSGTAPTGSAGSTGTSSSASTSASAGTTTSGGASGSSSPASSTGGSSSTSGTSSSSAASSSSAQGGTAAAEVVDGYATVAGNTTGGAGGSTVTVTGVAALRTEAARSGAEIIKVSGRYTCTGDVPVSSNKTILGIGADAGMIGCGLKLTGVSNVIIRNLKIAKVTAASGTGDAIHLERSTHVWIDHNDLSSDLDHGKDYYDGLIDITHASDYVTVSWNKLHDHYKASLVGHSDSNAAEDTGHLHVTYHHNWFLNINSRMPSLRFGTGHVCDNYFAGGDTGVHSRMGAQMLVQNNVFRNVSVPIETTGDSSQDGYVNQSGNDLGGGSNKITQTGTFTTPPYPYRLDPTGAVIRLVTAGAGTGIIG